MTEDGPIKMDLELFRALGKRGRLGIGIGMISRTSPYRDYDGNVSQFIPSISYQSENLQVYGPRISYNLYSSGNFRLAATGRFRIGVYEEDDSDYLTGMGDRESSVMAGFALRTELPAGVNLSLSYQHDVLDEIGGGEATLGIRKSFQAGIFRFSPQIKLNWLSDEISNHDFGIPVSKALPGRPAYQLDDVLTIETGLSTTFELSESWLLTGNLSVEFFGDEIRDSPIVEKDYVIKGFISLNYLF